MKLNDKTLLPQWIAAILAQRPALRARAEGKVGYALLWLMGIPLPLLLVIYFIRGH